MFWPGCGVGAMLSGRPVLNLRAPNFERSSRYNRAPMALPFDLGPTSPQGRLVNHMFSQRASGTSARAFEIAQSAIYTDLPLTRPGDKT